MKAYYIILFTILISLDAFGQFGVSQPASSETNNPPIGGFGMPGVSLGAGQLGYKVNPSTSYMSGPPIGYEAPKSIISDIGTRLQGLIEKLPEGDLKNGLSKYLEIISLESYQSDFEVAGSNKGLAAFLSRNYAEGSCFRDLTNSFYEELKMRDAKQGDDSDTRGQSSPLRGRPSLAERAGVAPHSDVNNGWLWQAALRYANNNSNLAMALIAVCGHDDTAQGDYVWFDDSLNARKEIKNMIDANTEKIKLLHENIKEVSSEDYTFRDIIYELQNLTENNSLLNQQTQLPRRMSCPRDDSKMYLPESLGRGVNISEELQSKISSIQAPTKGAVSLPAKHYHVYGGAFMACQLIQEGVKPKQAIFLQKQAARFYRGLRMCEVSKSTDGQREKLFELYEKYKKEFRSKKNVSDKPLSIEKFVVQEYMRLSQSNELCLLSTVSQLSNQNKSQERKKEQSVNDLWLEKNGESCRFLPFFVGLQLGLGFDKNMIEEKVATAIEKVNTGYLYQKWYIGGGKVLGVNIPCTDFRLSGPSSLLGASRSSRRNQTSSCGRDISVEACNRAKERLATWDVDFEWTIAQHEAGAKFAVKNCKKNEGNKSINEMACEATDSKQKGKPQEGTR